MTSKGKRGARQQTDERGYPEAAYPHIPRPKGWDGFTIYTRTAVVDGQVRIVSLEILPRDGKPLEGLTMNRLRTLPLAEMAAVDHGARSGGHQAAVSAYLKARKSIKPADAQTTALIEQVAAVWNAAYERGEPPRKAVIEQLRMTEPTATRWIKRARGTTPPLITDYVRPHSMKKG